MNDSFKSFFLENYLENLQNLYSNSQKITSKIDYNSIFYEIINLFFDFIRVTSGLSQQTFPTNFSRWVYLLDKYSLSSQDLSFLKNLNSLKKNIRKKKLITKGEFESYYINILKYSYDILSKIENLSFGDYDKLSNQYDNQFINDYSINSEDEILNSTSNNKIRNKDNLISIKGILKEKREKKGIIKNKIFVCYNDTIGKFFVRLNEQNEYLFQLSAENSSFFFINLEVYDSQKLAYDVSGSSYIVYEPDYLFDVTEIAECITLQGANPSAYFLKLFSTSQNSIPLIKGTLVNSIFDELIVNPNIDFETVFHKAIKQRPLRLLPMLNKSISNELRESLKDHFEIISKNIVNLPLGKQLIEPTFISSIYGLQGRLDLLIEFPNDSTRREVMELKSGKSPTSPIRFRDSNSNLFLNTWTSHAAQANGYNLLLDSVFDSRTGSSSIFYSTDSSMGMRNVPNVFEIKNNFIEVRNRIYLRIQELINSSQNLLNLISAEDFPDKLHQNSKQILLAKIKNLSKFEKHYYSKALKFILKEELISKIGNGDSKIGLSALWNSTLEEKLDNFSIIINLKIDENSDFELMHIILNLDQESDNINFLRKGDQCLLYPFEVSENPSKFYIIKGFIREISSETILVSLLNKTLDQNLLKKYSSWILEVDKSDSLIKKQYSLVNKFFESDKIKRDLLFGFKEPEFNDLPNISFEYLNEYQNLIINKSISAKDYFLIQGPPGTGKTSRIIRAISDYYFNNSDKKVLLCAYTNRAVDEICSALDSIQKGFPFIRISGKELENYSERSLPFLSDQLKISGLKKLIMNTRFFVSTISSLQTNPEIFDLVNFDVLILDEASQVLETQIIGILSLVEKFILIGDEKQLPAIVLQEKEEDEQLKNKIHLNSFSESLFQRLLRVCEVKNWNNATAILTHQGRMHEQIQQLSNFLVYNNKLIPFDNDWQKTKESKFLLNSNYSLKKLFENRVTFINSPIIQENKYHKWEAKLISKITSQIFKINPNNFTEKTVGVISPYRLQCRTIINVLTEEIRNLVTVDTVERFQGSEREIIIMSFATNYEYLLSGLTNEIVIDGELIDRKLNVAITRAKEHLILIGNETILSKSEIYRKAIGWIKENGTYLDLSNNL